MSLKHLEVPSRPALTLGLVLLCGASFGCSGTGDTDPQARDDLHASGSVDGTNAPAIDPESGQPLTDATAKPEGTNPDGYVAPASSSPRRQGNQDTPASQRRKFLVTQNLKKARRAMGLKIWDDAVTAAARVLELEENEEARRILQRAQANLGDRLPDMAEHTRQQHIRAELEKQRDLFRARDFLHQGDLASRQNEFVKAHQMFERARLTLQYSPWFTPGSDLEKTISGKIRQALEDQKAWLRRRTERIASGTRTRLMEDEREARLRQERKVSELFTQSNLAFQHKRYGRSIELLDEALELDPLSQDAKDLRELAMRATHDSNLDRIKRDWRRHWAATFQELQSSDVTQVDPIKHDLLRWREVTSKRKPLEFSTYDVEEDPDTAEILKTLEQNVVATEFDEMQLTAWVDYYRRATGLTIAPSPKVRELDEAETTLFNFKIGKKSVRKALDLIARIKPLKWQVSDGIVHILTKDEGSGAMVPRIYDVREIINPLAQHPGRDILLAVGEGDEDLGDEEEPTPAVVDVDKLQELIRANVMPDTWEADGVSINPQGPTLVINQTLAVHAAIDKLLGDLRGTSGIQVDIEARFLRVEDNFLEEVGVDFRGLGNQASEGKAGMGLQGDRTGFGFDDYGTNTSASAPTEVGSGFEPGIFYNDGGDGDIFGRTENLFDRVLGGGEEGLSNAGGLAFQWTYLDDTEIEIILRAVQKQERVEQISAPRLLVHNTARAHLAVNRQFSYIRDFNVEIAQAAAVADPVVSVVRDGVILDVRPVVAADRKYILMELRPTVATLALPIPTFTTSLGVGQPVSIQLPRLTLQKVRTTVVMPDGGTLLLGGMKNVQKHSFDSGVPILKDLPGLSFLFSHKGTYRANKKILILLRASVVIPPEWEPAQRK